MSLFKRAAARGVAHELVRNGLADFGSKQAMDEAADTAADMMMHHAPDMSGDEGHDPETVAALAERLMAIADQLEGMGHGDKHASESLQVAAQGDVMKIASEAALSVMEKAAYETRTAAVMEGGDKGNTEMQAAATDSVAALDLKNRPEGYAADSRGTSQLDTSPGMVGQLSDAHVQPARTIAGTNSVIEASKAASEQALYMDLFRKTASDVGPYLPSGLSEDQKIAAIQQMMPLDRSGRQTYITAIHQAKQAEMSDLMEALHEKKETKAEEKKEHAAGGYEQGKKDEEKEEKGEKEEAKKEGAAILDAIRRIARETSSYR